MEKVFECYKVVDLNTNRKVRLYYERVGEKGADFHSLTIEGDPTLEDDFQAEITQETFQAGNELRRWVADVHSFDYANRTIIVKVGEENPIDKNTSEIVYTWRIWDIDNNKELETLMVCENVWDRPNV